MWTRQSDGSGGCEDESNREFVCLCDYLFNATRYLCDWSLIDASRCIPKMLQKCSRGICMEQLYQSMKWSAFHQCWWITTRWHRIDYEMVTNIPRFYIPICRQSTTDIPGGRLGTSIGVWIPEQENRLEFPDAHDSPGVPFTWTCKERFLSQHTYCCVSSKRARAEQSCCLQLRLV